MAVLDINSVIVKKLIQILKEVLEKRKQVITKHRNNMKEIRKNAIEYWYPKIKDIVPTPRTIIVKAESEWDKTGNYLLIPQKYVKEIIKQAKNFKYPIFVRGSDSSCKHNWKDTCFVKSEQVLEKHLHRIANETECLDMFGSMQITSIALREYIEMDTKFKFFWGELPINPERRYFIYNHKIICHHFYWTNESIDEQYQDLLDEMNIETDEERNQLNRYACEIAEVFEGYWSIDFCRAKTGQWYCIDMAIGYRSWHPKCNLKMV